MADEPSNSELAWRLDDMRRLLADLVGRAEYNAHQQGIDRRFDGQGTDIQELHRKHEVDVEALHRRISDHETAGRANHQSWRTLIYTGVIPATIALAAILVQLWIGAHR